MFSADLITLQILKLKAELAKASSNPEKLLLEALHSTGYSGALANPLIAPESSISRLNADVLEQFIAVSSRDLCLLSYTSKYPH
jgi:hypothetical protein